MVRKDADMTAVKPQTAAEIMAMVQDTSKPLFGSWLESLMPVLIAGEPGCGKSWFVYWLAAAMANGTRAFGWDADTQSRVAIVDAEMRLSTIQRRLRIITDAVGDTGDRLTILARHRVRNQGENLLCLQERADQKRLLDCVAGCEVLILDNVNSLFPAGNENDPQFWAPMETFIWSCQDRGITPIFVHHTPKTNNRSPAGSSRNRRIFEVIIVLEKADRARAGACFSLSFDKLRELPDAATSRTLALVKDQLEPDFWRWEVSEQPHAPTGVEERRKTKDQKRQKALDLRKDGLSFEKIAQTLEVSTSTAHEWCK